MPKLPVNMNGQIDAVIAGQLSVASILYSIMLACVVEKGDGLYCGFTEDDLYGLLRGIDYETTKAAFKELEDKGLISTEDGILVGLVRDGRKELLKPEAVVDHEGELAIEVLLKDKESVVSRRAAAFYRGYRDKWAHIKSIAVDKLKAPEWLELFTTVYAIVRQTEYRETMGKEIGQIATLTKLYPKPVAKSLIIYYILNADEFSTHGMVSVGHLLLKKDEVYAAMTKTKRHKPDKETF